MSKEITKEDLDLIGRAAIAQGVANNRTAAMARVLEALVERTAGGGGDSTHTVQLDDKVSDELSRLTERLGALEEAWSNAEVPDVAELEATISDLRKRLGTLEEKLGGSPAAETKRTSKSRKSG